MLLAAIEVTSSVLRGETWTEYNKWIQLLAVIDIMFSIVCSFLFTYVMKDY
jgi:hypothetical protein